MRKSKFLEGNRVARESTSNPLEIPRKLFFLGKRRKFYRQKWETAKV